MRGIMRSMVCFFGMSFVSKVSAAIYRQLVLINNIFLSREPRLYKRVCPSVVVVVVVVALPRYMSKTAASS